MHTFSRFLCAAALLLLAGVLPVRAEEPKPEILESLTVGEITYTNVQVMNRTRTDIFIKHSRGVLNVKVRDLDKSTQLQLGYHLAETGSTNFSSFGASRREGPEFRLDPRLEEIKEQIVWETEEYLRTASHKVLYGAAGTVCVLYLFFCWCCSLICRKAGLESVGLVWLPLFKQIPLLRAAGMSPWWILTNLLPPLFVIAAIVWCFKISKARGKSALTAIFLLLPGFNVLAFLYLAFADRLEGDDDNAGNGRVVSLSQTRRPAA